MIDKENLSNDPEFNMKEEIRPGDEITATVIRTDDGEGNLVLSRLSLIHISQQQMQQLRPW